VKLNIVDVELEKGAGGGGGGGGPQLIFNFWEKIF